MKENDFIITGKGGSYHYTDLFNEAKRSKFNITDKAYCGGIKIDDNNVAITSNDKISNGENKLLLFNTNNKKSYSINDYSFVDSVNGLALMTKEDIKCNYRVLLCACKNYKKKQKNGIFLSISNWPKIRNWKNFFMKPMILKYIAFVLYQMIK